MTSGNLLGDRNNPLEGLGFAYLETNVVSREVTIHHQDGSSTPMEGADTAEEA